MERQRDQTCQLEWHQLQGTQVCPKLQSSIPWQDCMGELHQIELTLHMLMKKAAEKKELHVQMKKAAEPERRPRWITSTGKSSGRHE